MKVSEKRGGKEVRKSSEEKMRNRDEGRGGKEVR